MKFDQDLCLNLRYELNPRVRCAFGNVSIHTSTFLFELPNSKKLFFLLPAKNGKEIEVDLMMKCGWVGPCVVGLLGQVGAGHLTHPSPHLPHFVLLGSRKRCWFGKNGTIWMNKRCREGENGVDEKKRWENWVRRICWERNGAKIGSVAEAAAGE